MAKIFRPYTPDQLLLLPPSLREWLPDDHPVYFVNDLVETLDLEPMLSIYDEERGFPPYHPMLMTKLIVYGYVRGVRSSRKVQRACLEDVAFRVLAVGQSPDFRTIAAFRARHLAALEGLFAQVVDLCREAGLVTLGHLAVDSTKIRAHASKHKAMSYARMKAEEERLRADLRRWFEECDEVDAAEDELYGPDKTGDELPEELADPKRRLQKIQEAKAALEADAKAAGKDEPEAKAQRNFTDPDSRIMVSSDKAFIQAYNCQAAVDADSQVIVVAQVSQTAPDQGQLVPLVEQVTLEQEQAPKRVSADAGYWKESDIDLLEVKRYRALRGTEEDQALRVAEDDGAQGADPERPESQGSDAAQAVHQARTSRIQETRDVGRTGLRTGQGSVGLSAVSVAPVTGKCRANGRWCAWETTSSS